MTGQVEPVAAPPGEEPPDRRRLGRVAAIAVVALTLLGLGIRWWNIVEVRPICDPPREDPNPGCFDLYGGPSDALYGHLQGRLIAQGHWWVNPFDALSQPDEVPFSTRAQEVDPSGPFVASVGDPPLYQAFLGALSALGFHSGQSHRLLSALAGVSVVPLAAALARRLRSRRAAVLAAAIAAVHPLLWIGDGMLLSEAVYAPLVLGALLAAYRLRARPTVRRAAVLGLLVMLAAFARAEALVLTAFLALPATLLAPGRPWRQRWALLGATAAAAAALFVPWNLWINTRFDRPVMMTAASGSVLSASACDEHFYGRPLALFIYCPVDVEVPPDADEAEQDALVRDAALDYITDNLGRLPVVMAARVGRMWDLYGARDNLDMNIAVEDRGVWPSRTGLWLYYALLPLAVVGGVAMRRRHLPIWPMLTIAAMVTVTAAVTFGLTRYRVPADAVLVVLGASGLDAVISRVAGHRSATTAEGLSTPSPSAPSG